MSDPPPARPKPGSLRDRIAAFEQKGPPAAAAAPPPPRPKPGTLSKWAPKPASSPPPPSDAQSHSREGSVEGGTAHGGMSAADAKNAIGAGGSLKERMAALKGIGAFGGGGGSPGGEKPPPPKSEKPKWKPPPVVQMSPPIGGEDDEHVPVVSPPAAAEGVDKEEEGEKEVDDAEEEERQRRAAIAARMARLGGARVGMGPPVFGKKPTPPPKKPSLDANAPERVVSPPAGESKPVERVSSPPAGEETVAESKPAVPAAPEATTPAEAPTSPPPAMPIPAAPRRAAPPRRKTPAKSTPATTTPSLDVVPPTPGQSVDVHAPSPGAATGMPEADEGTRSVAEALADKVRSDDEFREAVPTPASEVKEVVEPPKEHHVELDEEVAKETEPEPTPVPVTETRPEPTRKGSVDVAAGVPVPETPAVEKEAPASIPEHEVPTQRRRSDASDARPESPELADETLGDDEAKEEEVPEVKREEEPVEEEDEGARKKRIAEKVAKMGGFNPFSAPPAPQRKQTMEEPELSGEKQEHPVHEHHDAVAGIAHPTTEAEKEIHDAVEEREGVSVDDISRVQAEEQAATLEPEEVDAMTAGPEVDIDRAVSQSGLPVEVVEKEDEEQKEEKEKFVDEMREFEGEVKSPTLEVPPQPQLERKGSSGSMRSYKVTTIGRGVQPEEDDEDGGY
ncbi:hypothetical protein PENSPDRAFT_619792 [Peniophora sp. CONT]|nr:hypothetical protein PENSPDRAFT_619792 [Peniophora sp. CONT]